MLVNDANCDGVAIDIWIHSIQLIDANPRHMMFVMVLRCYLFSVLVGEKLCSSLMVSSCAFVIDHGVH